MQGPNAPVNAGPQHGLPQVSKRICDSSGEVLDDAGCTSRCNSAGKGKTASHQETAGTHEGKASKVRAIADSLDATNAAHQRCCKSHCWPDHIEAALCKGGCLQQIGTVCETAAVPRCWLEGDRSQHGPRGSWCDSVMAGACMIGGPCELKRRVLPCTFTVHTDATGSAVTMPNQVVWGWSLRQQPFTCTT